jgi:hypothetical protein
LDPGSIVPDEGIQVAWQSTHLPDEEYGEKDQGSKQEDESRYPHQGGNENLPPMPAVELAARFHSSLVAGFNPVPLVPPGAGAIQVRTNFRSPECFHVSTAIAHLF